MAKTDLHTHLSYSGKNPGFDETIDLAHGRLGNGGIFVIANCNDFRFEEFIGQKGEYNRDYIDSRAVYVPEKDMLVVKGQEMFTKTGHILALPIPFWAHVGAKDPLEAMKEARGLGASLDIVHLCYKWGIEEFLRKNLYLIPQFSSLEVFNGTAELSFPFVLPKNANKKALDFYTMLGTEKLNKDLGISASSDSHDVYTIGSSYTNLPDFKKGCSLVSYFDDALRNVKTLDKLHMEPNKRDAANHALDNVLAKVGIKR